MLFPFPGDQLLDPDEDPPWMSQQELSEEGLAFIATGGAPVSLFGDSGAESRLVFNVLLKQ